MELRLLGPFEIIDGHGNTLELRGAKLNGLLVVLALHAGEVVPTGRIIEGLWATGDPGPDKRVAGRSQQAATSMQPAVKDDASHLVVTAAAGYPLRIDSEAVDAVRFERLAADGRRLLADGMQTRPRPCPATPWRCGAARR